MPLAALPSPRRSPGWSPSSPRTNRGTRPATSSPSTAAGRAGAARFRLLRGPSVPRLSQLGAFALIAYFAIATASAQPASPSSITPEGLRLAALLDGLNVEALWQRGYHVDWRTGVSEGPPETTPGSHTHCSAFAAAAAERLGIYLLRPPEHRQNWLANAQERWLDSPQAASWHRIGRLADPGASLNA